MTRPRPRLLLLLSVGVLVAACGGVSGSATPDPTTQSTALVTEAPESGPPSEAPSAEPAPVDPTEAPTDPPSEAPTADPGDGAAAACSGSDENREFFAAVAESVDWPVYCPVLAEGWFVASGEYRLAGGGWLEIAFRGPGGARIDLREGAICSSDDCVPSGTDLGKAPFGGMTGMVSDLGDGRFAVVVGPEGSLAWTLVGSGLAEADVRTIAADLASVGG